MSSLPPEAQDRRDRVQAPARMVISVLKLVKACLLYDDANQAVQQMLGPSREAIATFCAVRRADAARILFAGDVVFVNRRVLRAGRETVMLACELGEYLARCQLSEVTFEQRVGPTQLLAFARLLADAQRDVGAAGRLRAAELAGIAVRWVEMPTDDWLPTRERSQFARVVRDFAASTFFMQRFYAHLAKGELQLGNRVKRVAQKLVAIGEDAPQLAAALAAARFPDADPGRVVVSTAILACGMARMIEADRPALVNLATAALMSEVGDARCEGGLPQERLAASALVILGAAGQLHPAVISRSVMVHDALVVEGEAAEGSTVLGRVLRVARAFNRVRVPVKGRRAPGVDWAVAELGRGSGAAACAPFVQLLVGALGFFPVGSIVELDTGEIAAVAGVPRLAVDYRRPPVRVLCDASSNFLPVAKDIDLSTAARGEPQRSIRRALGTLESLRQAGS